MKCVFCFPRLHGAAESGFDRRAGHGSARDDDRMLAPIGQPWSVLEELHSTAKKLPCL